MDDEKDTIEWHEAAEARIRALEITMELMAHGLDMMSKTILEMKAQQAVPEAQKNEKERVPELSGYPKRKKSLKQRLLRKSRQEDRGYETPCLVWMGEKDKDGYGRIKRNGKYVPTHWVIKGDPPEGHEVDHLCHQRDCIRPSHLEHVTRAVNTERRRSVGEKRRMTAEERSVARALLAEGKTVADVSLATGFSRRTIGRLKQ